MRRVLLGVFTFCAMDAAGAGDSALAAWFDKVPAPPKTLAEAQSRVKVTERRTLSCSGFKEYKDALAAYRGTLETAHQKAEHDLSVQKGEPQTVEEATAQAAKMQAAMAKSQPAQDQMMAVTMKYQTEMQALMQKGLPPEKMAAEMQQLQAKYEPQMQAAQAKLEQAGTEIEGPKVDLDKGESPQVLSVRAQLDGMQEIQPESVSRLMDSHKNDHDRLNETLRDKGAQCYDPHVAAAGTDLQTEQAEWAKIRGQIRQQAADADKLFASVKYGAATKTAFSREQLIGRQMDWLSRADNLAAVSESICIGAVAWSKSREFVAGGGDVCDQPSYFKLCGPESIGRDYTTIARTCEAKRRH